MSHKNVLIVSPDAALVAALEAALASIKDRVSVVTLRAYPSREKLGPTIDQYRPSLVLVGLSDPHSGLPIVESLRQTDPQIAIAVAHTVAVSDLILAGMRAGASDFLVLPIDEQVLRRLLSSPAKHSHEKTKRGKLLCFLPARGGCGGSTISLHTGAAIARHSEGQVLWADLDFHASTVDLVLGLEVNATLADAIQFTTDLDEMWDKLTHRWYDMDLLAAPPNGHSIQSELLTETPKVLESARRHYGWVICDLPPAVYSSSIRILSQAEAIYVVTTSEVAALRLARRRVEELHGVGVESDKIRLVVNRFVRERDPAADDLAKILNVPVSWTIPNDYQAVKRALDRQRLVPPQSKLGIEFEHFARRVAGPGKDSQSPRGGFGFELRQLFSRVRGEDVGARKQTEQQAGTASKPLNSCP